MNETDWKSRFSLEQLEQRKEYQREYQRAWRQTPDGKIKSRQAWAKYNMKIGRDMLKEKAKETTFYWRLKQLGVTPQQFLELIEKGCAICGKRNLRTKKKRVLCLDHNHLTGKFRGILCNGCNTALGKFNDDPEMVERAAAYLRENG